MQICAILYGRTARASAAQLVVYSTNLQMVNSTLQHTDARAVRPYEVGTAYFDTPSYSTFANIVIRQTTI